MWMQYNAYKDRMGGWREEKKKVIEEMQIAICILYERKMFWHINFWISK